VNRVKLVIRDDAPRADATARNLRDLLSARGVSAGEDDVDAVIAIGGDGTVLEAAAGALKSNIPVCGVKVGRVGYLAEFAVEEIEDLADAIAKDSFETRRHGTVSVSTTRNAADAINDVVVEKVISQRIIEVTVAIDSRPLATYRTDGIIVATALGSTAYSLSAGGPIVDPALGALIMTPVAPHSLLTRAIVLASDAVLTLTVAGDRPARINVDGKELCTVEPEEPITVRQGVATVEFLTLGRHPFPHAVREQFGLDHA
jgi:NAD+ kinase